MTRPVDISIKLVETQDARCTEVETLLREHHEAMTCLEAEETIQMVIGLIREGAELDGALRAKACADPTWRCEDLYGRLNGHLMRVEKLATGALSLGHYFRENGYEVHGLEDLEADLSDLRWTIRPETVDWRFLEKPLQEAFQEHLQGKTEMLLPLPE